MFGLLGNSGKGKGERGESRERGVRVRGGGDNGEIVNKSISTELGDEEKEKRESERERRTNEGAW